MLTLAYTVIITAVIALVYLILEYYLVPKHGSQSGLALVSAFVFLAMLGAFIAAIGLSFKIIF